ncbi:hypothetical protein WH47_01704 [Habropoda laboriosa]|uniref:Uncharacterized protein n=1 Tax=Habropoda laboriosa TaxID=597456 RepID=A0A0L7QJQ2_9HYME|nr:hypothetical protein WH47_01704 [Habropoda laboriosa]
MCYIHKAMTTNEIRLEEIQIALATLFCTWAVYFTNEKNEAVCEECANSTQTTGEKLQRHQPSSRARMEKCTSCKTPVTRNRRIRDCEECMGDLLEKIRRHHTPEPKPKVPVDHELQREVRRVLSFTSCTKLTFFTTNDDRDLCMSCARTTKEELERYDSHGPVRTPSTEPCDNCEVPMLIVRPASECPDCVKRITGGLELARRYRNARLRNQPRPTTSDRLE